MILQELKKNRLDNKRKIVLLSDIFSAGIKIQIKNNFFSFTLRFFTIFCKFNYLLPDVIFWSNDISKKTIYFLCTGNSCRSQMAEGWAKHILNRDEWDVKSAGIEAHGLNPYAVKAMKEAGIDISIKRRILLTRHFKQCRHCCNSAVMPGNAVRCYPRM